MSTTTRSPHEICPHCRTRGSIRRPARVWRVAFVGAWAYAFVSTFAVGNIGPFIMIILPFFMFANIALISELHQRATAEPMCDVCGKIVVPGTELGAAMRPARRREHVIPHPA